VTTRGGDRVDHFGAEFIGKLPQVFMREPLHIGRNIDRIEKRRVGFLSHQGRPKY
jgi:hypothetical protein